jgi:pyruvate ferredoxin oxidoreductase beta subunit
MMAAVVSPGHRACAGCGEILGARLALEAAGDNIIVANATGCLEVTTTSYPYSAWNMPWIHSLFENAPAVASGIEAGLKALGKTGIRVIAQGGDGGTADIGLQSLSGMFERGHNILYICYDNEAYMNTGIQRSSLTPSYASTTTTPATIGSHGNKLPKKDMVAIALAHGVPYVATASVGYHKDLQKKVQKAMTIQGPKYLQIHVPCPLGWGCDSSATVKVAQQAVQCGLYPLLEFVNGKKVAVRRLNRRAPVTEYLRGQGRFQHLFKSDGGSADLEAIQLLADANVEQYGLV